MSKEELLAQGAASYKALLLPVCPKPFTRTALCCIPVPDANATSAPIPNLP